jgi:hypothetical protein
MVFAISNSSHSIADKSHENRFKIIISMRFKLLLHEINIADNDVLIVEIPKNEEFVFTPNS